MTGNSSRAAKVTILVVNWNGERFLEALLDSLLSTEYPDFDVVVVDNGSSDGSRVVLERYAARDARIRAVFLERNYGFAGGNNVGFREISRDTRYVAFLNTDCVVEADWLRTLVDFLDHHPTAAIVQPTLLRLQDPTKVDRATVRVDRLGYDVYNLFQDIESEGLPEAPAEVFSVTGAAFLARRDALEKVAFHDGLYDPNYFVYYEETDLCWRVRLAGHDIWYCPTSRVLHLRGGATQAGGRLPAALVFHHTKNRMSSLVKNYNALNVALWFPLLLLAELARALATLRSNREHALATFRGAVWVVRSWDEIKVRRRAVQKRIRAVPDRTATARMFFPDLAVLLRDYRNLYP